MENYLALVYNIKLSDQARPCHKAGEALAWGHILYSKNKVIFHIMFWTNGYLVWLYVIISLFHFYLIQHTSYANHIYYYFKPFCIVCGRPGIYIWDPLSDPGFAPIRSEKTDIRGVWIRIQILILRIRRIRIMKF